MTPIDALPSKGVPDEPRQIARRRGKALRFYAMAHNWKAEPSGDGLAPAVVDAGKRARKALAGDDDPYDAKEAAGPSLYHALNNIIHSTPEELADLASGRGHLLEAAFAALSLARGETK